MEGSSHSYHTLLPPFDAETKTPGEGVRGLDIGAAGERCMWVSEDQCKRVIVSGCKRVRMFVTGLERV